MRLASFTPFVLAAALAGGAVPAQAGELYTGIGLPGLGLGYAHALSPSLSVRGDVFSLGSREGEETESGIRYRGKVSLHRAAVMLDWFPFAGSFRLSTGLTFNNQKIVLDASGAGGTLTIGDRTYTTTAADGLRVDIEVPKTTPYLGIGWGHQLGQGWRFVGDIGAAIGRAKLSAVARGQLAQQPDIQSDIDKELAELRDGVGKVRVVPQVSIGFGYSF
jgi:hypothetical protein